jgi:hypothetical protein
MASITVSVPKKVKSKMDEFPEMNWSSFVTDAIAKRIEGLKWKKDLLEQAKKEEAFSQWAVELVRAGRKGRYAELKRDGVI